MATSEYDSVMKEEAVETDAKDMDLKREDEDVNMNTITEAEPAKQGSAEAASPGTPSRLGSDTPKRQSRSPVKMEDASESPVKEDEEMLGGDVTLKLEPGRPPKLQRTTSRKVERRPPPLFLDYEDKTDEATSSFSLLQHCTYANKYMGLTEPALECDCAEEWDASTQTNHACDEDSDCINRATRMECGEDCGCGAACQNQRFTRQLFANVTVIKTEKKGYGLRTNVDLKANDFIFEYIGEVIGENAFRKRMQNYDSEGIKHFYFMSLTKGEFVDATKRGNLGRFCNHSCNPNCYVDKWVVGDKLRMGIFAERKIQAGEELVFNYNVDRYGAEPQPCYCGEPNCTGFIGGKTQTERATKLSNTIIEALGIDDADAWDTAVAKRPRKKKASEDDEEYVNNVEPRGLDEEGVNKVMSSLMQCKEKWIAVKLLSRIQRADDERVRNRVVRFHGYRILKTVLSNFEDDVNVCLQVLDVLERMPRITRNKINDSKIEDTVQPLTENEDQRVSTQAKGLMEAWSKLEVGYRIPRMKRDPNATAVKTERVDRRGEERRRSRSPTKSPEPAPKAPTGPKNNAPARPVGFRPPPRFRGPPPPGPLPPGWRETTTSEGKVYFWNDAGAVTWQRPSMPDPNAPPPPPSKAQADQAALQDLINNIVTAKPAPKQPSATPTPVETPKKQSKEEKWRSLPEEKQKKVYEGTISPHIMQVANKQFRHKLNKEDFKRLARDLTKTVAKEDYRKGRVRDPTKYSEKQIEKLKKHTEEYFGKFVKRQDAKRAERKKKPKSESEPVESHTPEGSPPPAIKDEMDADISDAEGDVADMTPAESSKSPAALKRRREEETANGADDDQYPKRVRASEGLDDLDADSTLAPPPPPPPPPPPAGEPLEGDVMDVDQSTLTPGEDVSGSFTHDAIVAVHDATVNGDHATKTLSINSRPASAQAFAQSELTQTATPPTTGSPDVEDAEKTSRRQNYAGMNPERLRQLGLYDGSAD